MGQRVVAPELQALYDKGAQVYSYSKLGTIHDCPYNAYLLNQTTSMICQKISVASSD